MIVFLLAAAGAMVLFPVVAGRALAGLVERLEIAGWWAVASLATTTAATWCVIYRDAVRLDYAGIVAGLWREWVGRAG